MNTNNPYALPSNYKSIKEWREDERPRERLLQHGAQSLSDAELLAIFLGTGTRGTSAIDVARNLLQNIGKLNALPSKSASELQKVKGVGKAKAITLLAAIELSRRIEAAPFHEKKVIRSPQDVASYYIPRLRGAQTESFRVLLLNSANQVFKEIIVSTGSLNASIVHPREVFKHAITESAASIILMHNHPSGNTEPSREDIAITKQLVEAGKIIDIKVLDHLIIAGEEFTSLQDRNLM